MNRLQIQALIDEGYDVLAHGVPVMIEGDLWEYLDTLDEGGEDVYVLTELLKLTDQEIEEIFKYKNN